MPKIANILGQDVNPKTQWIRALRSKELSSMYIISLREGNLVITLTPHGQLNQDT